jgi:hypothetical protein
MIEQSEMYDYDEEIISPKEEEMNNQGYTFITNFRSEREEFYRQAAEAHNLKYSIENETYNSHGKKIGNGEWSKAFYVDSTVCDLTDFWSTYEQIKLEHSSQSL